MEGSTTKQLHVKLYIYQQDISSNFVHDIYSALSGLVMMEKCEWRFGALLMCCRWVRFWPHVHLDTLWYSNPRKFPIIQETNSCQYMSVSWEKDVWCEFSKGLFGESVKLSTSLFISRCFEVYELWQSYVICIYPRMWSSHWHHGIIEQYYDEEILILKGRGW